MHDELEQTSESATATSAGPAIPARLEMLDVAGAIAAAEKAAGSIVFGDTTEARDLGKAIADAVALAETNERAAILAPVDRMASMREVLRQVAGARLGLVAHAIAGHGGEDLSALADLGWGVLVASGPEDSFDLTLVARRAAEDSGVPFLVVHGLGRATHPAGRAVAMVGVPHDKAMQGFLGSSTRKRSKLEPPRASGSDRAFAERVPFALGAALREYGSVSGRRHDVFDKSPLGESPLVLVGMGPVGDALFCAAGELRARGYDVGAVQITSLRPFPGPRLVKALGRALAVTVLEPADEPLAHGGLLAREVKSAFTDALTWVPGFPGIGRIPKLFVGATGPAFDIADLVAVCENMLADERGRRIFSFVDVEHALPRVLRVNAPPATEPRAEREVGICFVLDDVNVAELVLTTVGRSLATGVGLRTQGIVTATTPGAGAVLDVVASRGHARGGMARRAPRLVVASERGVASAGAVVALSDGAVLAVLEADSSGTLPETVRSVLRERRARVLRLALGEGAYAAAATAAGAALAAASRAMKTPLDGAAVARIVSESVAGPDAEAAGQRARGAFEATYEVISATGRGEPEVGRPIGVA